MDVMYTVMLPRPASLSLFQHIGRVGMASTLFGVFVRSRGCSAWARLGGVVCLLPAEWQTHWNRREYRGSDGGNNTQEREMLYFLRIGR
eukprot:scaffold27_cov57-Cyclotella_meneghiniana.AAC.3